MTSMITRRRVLQTGVAAAALAAMPQTGLAADRWSSCASWRPPIST